MNENSRSDCIPVWSSVEHRCLNDAAFKVFRSHGAGINSVGRNRCIADAAGAFGPATAVYRDPEAEVWQPTN